MATRWSWELSDHGPSVYLQGRCLLQIPNLASVNKILLKITNPSITSLESKEEKAKTKNEANKYLKQL
jgi:hypothetical protein